MSLRWPDPHELRTVAAWDPRAPRTPRTLVQLVPSVGWGGAERLACTVHRMALAGGWRSRIEAPSIESVARGIYEDTGARPPMREGEETLDGWAKAARARVAFERPSLVHAHLAYPDRYGLARSVACGRPLVASFGLLPPDDGQPWPPDAIFHQRCDRALAAYARLPAPTVLVAPSRRDYARLAKWVPERRLAYVQNEPPLPRLVETHDSNAPDPWGDDERCVRILSVGRLHAQKGYDRALTALASPSVRALRWRWVVAGGGDELDWLRARANELGIAERVAFVGAVSAEPLYARASLLLSAARYEGMPLVPFEAIDAGVPVLASGITPHEEQLAATPEALLPERDEAAWPARIAALLSSADARAALLARQRAARPAHPQRALFRAYDALYASLAHS